MSERVAWLEIDLGRLLRLSHGPDQLRPVSRYPSSDIDLAFEVAESAPAGDVESALRQADRLVVDVRLFDVYRGDRVREGTRSLAYRVRLQATDRTLTDDELGEARQRLIDAVESKLPAELRG